MGGKGYKGYCLEKLRAGSYQLLSPSGVPIAGFSSAIGSPKPRILPWLKGWTVERDTKPRNRPSSTLCANMIK